MNTIIIIIQGLGLMFLLIAVIFLFIAVGINNVIQLMDIKYPNNKFLSKLKVESSNLSKNNFTKALYSGYIGVTIFIILIVILCLK